MDRDLQATNGKAARQFFIDHLRVSLVILVVVHHVALVYGAAAPFYYVEPPFFTDLRAFRVLLVFVCRRGREVQALLNLNPHRNNRSQNQEL